jgi:hypothetical protein
MKIRIIKKGLPKAQIVGQINFDKFMKFPTAASTQPTTQQTIPPSFASNLQDIVTGNNPYASVLQDYNDKKLQEKYPTLGPTPREQELEKAGLAPQMSNLTAGPKPFDIGKAARTASTIGSGLLMAGSVVDYFGQNRKEKEFDRQFRRNQFDTEATSPMFRGNWNINTGTFRDDVTKQPNEGMFQMGGEENFTNVNNTMKIRITGRPQNLEFEYGGQSGYGFDLGQRRVQTEMPQSKSDSVRRTIQEVPRDEANIEAEARETIYGDFDGDGGLEHMLIGGERHYNGGTPLNVPEGSFVFSDTPKMKIKDPEILKYFGLPGKKGGYTPAEIAKRYDVNKYKAIIEDPNADERDKSTASLMANNLKTKLSKLAVIQESMKGFPQGMPSVAQQGQDKEEMAMARYGGSLPKFQGATTGSTVASDGRVSVWDEDEQKTLQEYMKKNYKVGIPINARETDPNSQRFTLPSMQNRRDGKRVYGDEDWTASENIADFAMRQKNFMAENPNWDPTQVGATKKFQIWYDQQREAKGMKPYFGKGQKFQDYDDKFGEYTFSAPDLEPSAPEPEKKPTPDPTPDPVPGKDPEPDPNKYTYGEKTPEGNVGFLTPDKLTLLNAGLTPPRAYYPFAPPLPFRKGTLALDDWRAQAQQRQGTFNTAASTLGQYQPGTALASNLSFMAGQTGEGVSQDIASVNSRNVDRANQFMSQEVQRQGNNDMFNAQRMQDLFDKRTITKQQYDNAMKKYTSGITKAANNAFANRMYLDMTNKVNPMFNVDPRTGLSFFKNKQGYGTDQFTSGSNMGGLENFANRKRQLMAAGISDTAAEKTALDEIKGARTTYTDSEADGIPNSVRTTVPGGGLGLVNTYRNAFGNFNPSSMFGGQIGPWFNKKKKK